MKGLNVKAAQDGSFKMNNKKRQVQRRETATKNADKNGWRIKRLAKIPISQKSKPQPIAVNSAVESIQVITNQISVNKTRKVLN